MSLLFSAACSDSDIPDDSTPVLAKINGEAITQAQLDASLISLFGEQQASEFDATARRKALEGLVASRVIALRAMEELDHQDRIALEYKVMQYRDKLLLGEYLKVHAHPEPVTDEMVKEYYEQHLQEFGGGSRKTFELLMAADKPAPDKRQELVKQLGEADKDGDWLSLAADLNGKGLKVSYRKGTTDSDAQDHGLLKIVSALAVEQISPVVFIDGKPLVVRVLSSTELSAAPLHEVSAGIRKTLAPIQLKEAISKVTKTELEKIQVEYR